ncbi:MAG: hypothetical protein IJB30_02600 [Clostridia bacterium]|nr:hypothetical protein [Clostridia bacterium]MBQ6703674.1 hypothetical protein [Clostridia bacterium]
MSRNQYAIARRSIWYLLRTMLSVALVIVLCLGAFVTAMHISNLYILVTEGLELRAEYVLQGGELTSLTEYFAEEFVARDPALYDGTYSDFTVTNFIYKIEIKNLFVLPWHNTATVKVYEKLLSVSGKANEGAPDGAVMPEWPAAVYNVKLTKTDGRWYISDMLLLMNSPEEAPLPTPDYSLLPSPQPQ